MGMGYEAMVSILWSGCEVLVLGGYVVWLYKGGYVVWLWVCTLVRVCIMLSEGGYVFVKKGMYACSALVRVCMHVVLSEGGYVL